MWANKRLAAATQRIRIGGVAARTGSAIWRESLLSLGSRERGEDVRVARDQNRPSRARGNTTGPLVLPRAAAW